MRALLLTAALLVAGCDIEERPDFMLGRECTSNAECDPGDACLPHQWLSEPRDRRCRSAVSFQRNSENREPPLAYCSADHQLFCPEGTVCRADRVRPLDGSIRREVCQPPAAPFGPPP